MTVREVYKLTDDETTFKKCHKILHAGCPLCPWHRGENRSRQPRHSSWKVTRRSQSK